MRARLIVETLCVQILLAISVNQVWASCLKPPLSAEAISQFKSNPQAMVAPNSDTRTIEALTRDLAGTDASLAADLVNLAKGTIPRFQVAIAAGLAQAAVACSTVDQQAAQLIQQAVAGLDDGQFQAAFAAVAGDLSTAATAAASAFATSGFGSVVVTNPNTSRGLTTNPGGGGTLTALQFTAPVIAINTTNTATNGPSATAANPVSPTR
jgi:hypothetical protein